MKEAIKVYSEILRCYDAIKKTKSEKLKNDYYKHISLGQHKRHPEFPVVTRESRRN